MKVILAVIIGIGLCCGGFCLTAMSGNVPSSFMFIGAIACGLKALSMLVSERIKILTLLLLVAVSCVETRADGPSTNQLVLTWDVLPDYGTNDTFYVYSSTNVAQPMSQWPAVTNVTFKQFMVATNVAIPPATDVKRFYTFVSSNFTGRSDFAEPDSCRRLPSGSGLRIGGR